MQLHVASEAQRQAIEARTSGGRVDARGLEHDLKRKIEGEVRFDDGSKGLYATDSSNWRQLPIGVVVPRTIEDVVTTHAVCREYGAPITNRGGGTSLSGQCCNVAVIIDCSKYLNRILAVDPDARTARVQAGVIHDQLSDPVRKKYNLTFGPDTSTHAWATFGGMLGNNSCGVHSVMSAPHIRTSDCLEEMEVLTYDGVRMRVGRTSDDELERIIADGGRRGQIYRGLKDIRDHYGDLIRERYPDIPRRVSGYNLDDLLPERDFHVGRSLVGTEGTCVTILEATVRLVYAPPVRSLVILGYDSVYTSGDHAAQIMTFGPTACEGIDHKLISFMEKQRMHLKSLEQLPEGKGFLLVEFGGESKEEADAKALEMMASLKKEPNPPSMKLYDDPEVEHGMWQVRESGLGATARVPGMKLTWTGWEDAACDPKDLGDYLRDFRKILDKHDLDCALYGHFGQACIHCRIDFDLFTHDGVENYRSFIEDASDLVASYHGSFTAEHGDGQAKAIFLPKLYGSELMEAMRYFKSLWDPDWKMNPGKVIEPDSPTTNLRLGADYEPWEPRTHYQFPEDGGSFADATLRCVGVGKCRRTKDAFMCPSFLATHEEKDSTRGRARLLFEMLNGEEFERSWRNEPVRDALDLCLGCKGCKNECPVNVDMATYKSEFLSHYYEGHVRPRAFYAMGLIGVWAKLAAISPQLANFFGQTPPLSNALKALCGVSQKRKFPVFAEQTFTDWYRKRQRGEGGRIGLAQAPHGHAGLRERVVLYPDVFNNHFHPETCKAALEVLRRLGYQVEVPRHNPPSIRPLMHYGMLPSAKRELHKEVRRLRQYARAGVPIIGLEPSTVSVFRDELPSLLHGDEDAKRIQKKFYLFDEFLAEREVELPRLERKAILHNHCHHKAVLDPGATHKVLKKMGVEFEEPDIGCCGMAGSFGFEAQHYDISMRIGERDLLPAVRQAGDDRMVIANGFSCRHQIAEPTGRHPLHLAQLILMAFEQGPVGPTGKPPEMGYVNTKVPLPRARDVVILGSAVLAGVAAAAIGTAIYKNRQ